MRREEIVRTAETLARPYRISPPRMIGGGPAGMFQGAGDGQSVDFHDFREYQPGDDLRRVDWRAYARNGQMHLRLFREEVSPVVELHLDTSASMAAYPGKEQIAVFLAAFFRAATLAADGRPVLCRDGGRFGGDGFAAALLATDFSRSGEARRPPPVAAGTRPLRFLFSDFLLADGLASLFLGQSRGSLQFCPVMILSRSETEPPWRGFYRLGDVEDAAATLDLPLNDASIAAYRERLRRHEEALSGLAKRHGAGLLRVDAPDGGVERPALEALVRRMAEERLVTTR